MDKLTILENLIAAEEMKHARFAENIDAISGLIDTRDLRDLFGIEQAPAVKEVWRAFHKEEQE